MVEPLPQPLHQPLSQGVELMLGGQKSGKSRRAEHLAAAWLALPPCQGHTREAVLIATGQAWDDEMAQRITRHQRDRAERVPGLHTLEVPLAVAQAITDHSAPHRLLVLDCLTLWLTNLLMPMEAEAANDSASNTDLAQHHQAQEALLLEALRHATGPVVLVGNEIGLGVIPLGREVRAFVDALGRLNQDVASVADRVVLMVAGCPLVIK
ncbi:MAG: bifunctional adenosylcobinamide kinase/adenosylcobinamide-phosphate guanylyltransferase [Pseudomonadota bacterium]